MNKTYVLGAVAFVALAVALVLGMQLVGLDANATPMATTIMGFIGLAITQLLSHAKTEDTNAKVQNLHKELHNGSMERVVQGAIERVADDDTSSLHIVSGREEPQ